MTPTVTTQPISRWLDIHPALGISMMDHLFNRLDGAYPHKWRSNFPSEQSIANWRESWAEAFEQEQLTPEDVKEGLKACRSRYDWPPSCAEFVKACRPNIDPESAWIEACEALAERQAGGKGAWSHPAIFWAATSMAFEIRSSSFGANQKRWERVLREQVEMGQWEAIPMPAPALPAPDRSGNARSDAKRLLEEISKLRLNDGKNPKRWAHRILERIANGEKLPPISMQFAREALGERAETVE